MNVRDGRTPGYLAWLFAFLIVWLLAGQTARADDETPDVQTWQAALLELQEADAAERRRIYRRLGEVADARIIPVLEAYRNGLLALEEGRLVIYQSREEIPGMGRVFPMMDAFTLEPITGEDGDPVYAERLGANMLRAARPDRVVISELVSALSLMDPDPAARRAAIRRAGDRADQEMLASLAEMLERDRDGPNALLLREAIARIELVHGSPQEKIEAATTLGETRSGSAAASLARARASAVEAENQALMAAIDEAAASVATYQRNIRWAQYTFSGLSQASILILMGLGLAIIFGLMGVINMAHGEFMMIGGITTYVVAELFKTQLPGVFDYYLIAAVPAAFLVAALVGWICEITVIRRLYGRPLDSLLATVGISLVLIQVARVMFGDTMSISSPSWLVGGVEVMHDFSLPLNRLYIIAFCTACIALTYLMVRGTRWGLLLRATTQNRETAASLGVSTRLIDGFTFAFGSGLAGLAGSAVVMFDRVNPQMGQSYIVESFMVVVLGGVGNLVGVIVSGLGLGFVLKYLEPMLASPPLSLIFGTTGATIYARIALLILIIAILQWKPRGLFPAKGRLADA